MVRTGVDPRCEPENWNVWRHDETPDAVTNKSSGFCQASLGRRAYAKDFEEKFNPELDGKNGMIRGACGACASIQPSMKPGLSRDEFGLIGSPFYSSFHE